MQVISNLLATGAAAGFIATRERQESFWEVGQKYYRKHFDKSYASASVLLLGFICTLILSIVSSYALPKRVNN